MLKPKTFYTTFVLFGLVPPKVLILNCLLLVNALPLSATVSPVLTLQFSTPASSESYTHALMHVLNQPCRMVVVREHVSAKTIILFARLSD